MTAKRYPFEGEMVTPAELSRRVTMFSKTLLGLALRAGCCSIAELHAYDARMRINHRSGCRKGARLSGLFNYTLGPKS